MPRLCNPLRVSHLSLLVVCVLIHGRVLIIFALLGQTALPKGTELRFDTLSDMAYSSTPEAGKPRLPFPDNSIRKAADEPWFWLEEEDDGTEVYAELEAREEPIDPSQQELEKREGTLIGLL